MSKKTILVVKIISTIIAVSLLIFVIIKMQNQGKAKYDGRLTVEFVGTDNNIIKSAEIDFLIGENMETILKKEFENIQFQNGMLISIEDFTMSIETYNPYIGIYVDDKSSNYGLLDENFEIYDGMKISLVITIYEEN